MNGTQLYTYINDSLQLSYDMNTTPMPSHYTGYIIGFFILGYQNPEQVGQYSMAPYYTHQHGNVGQAWIDSIFIGRLLCLIVRVKTIFEDAATRIHS